MLRHFSELGTTYNLSFTGEEVLGNRIIGVDGLKGKIVFVEHSGTAPACFVIDLAEVESCRVSKIYRSANAKNQDAYLHSIALEFDVVRSGQTVALPFYNPVRDAMQDAAEREAKAKSWASVLLKMLVKERKRV